MVVLVLPVPVCPERPNGEEPILAPLSTAHEVGGVMDADLLRAEGLTIHNILGPPVDTESIGIHHLLRAGPGTLQQPWALVHYGGVQWSWWGRCGGWDVCMSVY